MNFTDYIDENYRFEINNTEVDRVLDALRQCINNYTPIYVCGNGGSAYTANHFVQDLIKVCGANAFSMSENIGLILAVANDVSFEKIFTFQLQQADLNGVLIAVSCSGNSKNIIDVAKEANSVGTQVISLTSSDGGELKRLSGIDVNIPTENIYVAESVHSMLCHYWVDELRDK
jgi:D-sedoheptulose 7-phosphate isomerase